VGNELDEITGPVNPDGRDTNVIDKQLKVSIGAGTKFFELALWVGGILIFGLIGIAATGDFPILEAECTRILPQVATEDSGRCFTDR
jgi:LemA protein